VKDLPGLPATGRPFEIRGATVVEFRDGKISRSTDYWSLAEYRRQVGVK
jgi:ketosteroid isomerase-like protein